MSYLYSFMILLLYCRWPLRPCAPVKLSRARWTSCRRVSREFLVTVRIVWHGDCRAMMRRNRFVSRDVIRASRSRIFGNEHGCFIHTIFILLLFCSVFLLHFIEHVDVVKTFLHISTRSRNNIYYIFILHRIHRSCPPNSEFFSLWILSTTIFWNTWSILRFL